MSDYFEVMDMDMQVTNSGFAVPPAQFSNVQIAPAANL